MPHSVEMPAPVNGTITLASCTKSRRLSMAVSKSGATIAFYPRTIIIHS
jgi:hypothetical protein